MSQPIKTLETLFQDALALETLAERADYLDRACSDPAMRHEVESLLDGHQHPDRIFARDTILVQPTDFVAPEGHAHYLGKTLDEKYHLQRLLGEGGMGAVYLSTHLGTGRYVAVKLITPQFMRNQEFVERFKREAQAAGRLRHPNIVDVTDFGVARVDSEDLAYLVMEYLDGCTLGDVLAEEKRLPLHWVVDILEQVCSAVQRAHQQGIIHRDLKPANIWLEPNTLGGYRIKVLDFGIAKLAEVEESKGSLQPSVAKATQLDRGGTTGADKEGSKNPADNLAAPSDAETRIVGRQPNARTEALTRVGAILGTPLFMSPEQCHGDALDPRSDIYSLGIIAYLMISGTTPFTGEPAAVLRAHQESQPKPLREHDRKLPKAVSRVIMSALEKNPAARPQTAAGFAQSLHANAQGLGTLYRRSFALYCEYFPTVITLSLLAHIPVILVTLMTIALRVATPWLGTAGLITFGILVGVLKAVMSFLAGSAISGVIAIIVTQLAVTPLKPVSLRAAFHTMRGRWKPLFKTGLSATVRIILGFFLFVIPGMVLTVRYALWAPVVLLEGKETKSAFQRSRSLAARSWRTIVLAVLFQALVPIFVQWVVTRLAGLGAVAKPTVLQNVASELISLSTIFVLPLVSILLALVYLKMRQLGGEEMTQVMTRVEEPRPPSDWEKRMNTRLGSTT